VGSTKDLKPASLIEFRRMGGSGDEARSVRLSA
jgi:hypothetical protein